MKQIKMSEKSKNKTREARYEKGKNKKVIYKKMVKAITAYSAR